MRLRSLRATLLALAVLAAAPRPVLAWNKAGHMLTGVLAYRDLVARDPQAAARLVELLRQHPDYAARWKPFIDASGRPEGEMLFALAARWPDDVRGDPNYARGSWHYVNVPLHPPGDTTPAPAVPQGELLTILPKTLAVVRDTTVAAPQRAIALCWLMHLTGDAHQPMHAVAVFSAAYPQGDRGGNLWWVKPGVVEKPLNLHSLWDDVVLADQEADPTSVEQAADRLAKAFPRDAVAAQVAQLDPSVWVNDEDVAAARTTVYRDFTLPGVADTTMQRVPVVPAGYRKAARALGEQRITLASYRLSEELSAAMAR